MKEAQRGCTMSHRECTCTQRGSVHGHTERVYMCPRESVHVHTERVYMVTQRVLELLKKREKSLFYLSGLCTVPNASLT